jgi:hypothetical protein
MVEARESHKLTLRKQQVDNTIMNKRFKLLKKEENKSLEINPDVLNVDHTMSIEPVTINLT